MLPQPSLSWLSTGLSERQPLCTYFDSVNSIKVLKQCKSDFYAKIHETLLLKKHRPGLNKQLYAQGSSFLLNVCK